MSLNSESRFSAQTDRIKTSPFTGDRRRRRRRCRGGTVSFVALSVGMEKMDQLRDFNFRLLGEKGIYTTGKKKWRKVWTVSTKWRSADLAQPVVS